MLSTVLWNELLPYVFPDTYYHFYKLDILSLMEPVGHFLWKNNVTHLISKIMSVFVQYSIYYHRKLCSREVSSIIVFGACCIIHKQYSHHHTSSLLSPVSL